MIGNWRSVTMLFNVAVLVMVLPTASFSQAHLQRFSIMTIPATPDGRDIKTVITEDEVIRTGITKINEYLIEQGYTTLDFTARLKKAKLDGLIKSIDNNQTVKQKILEAAGPDIYLEVEISYLTSPTGNLVRLLFNAHHTATSTLLASFTCQSSKFYVSDVAQLTLRALKECEEDFNRFLNNGFAKLEKNGQPLQLHVVIEDEASFNFDMNFSDDFFLKETGPLRDLIELWLSENKDINYYRIRGASGKSIIFDELRINFRDSEGNYLSITKVLLKFKSYLRKLKSTDGSVQELQVAEDKIGGTIYIRLR